MSTRSPRGHTMAYDDCDFLQLLFGVVRSSNLSAARAPRAFAERAFAQRASASRSLAFTDAGWAARQVGMPGVGTAGACTVARRWAAWTRWTVDRWWWVLCGFGCQIEDGADQNLPRHCTGSTWRWYCHVSLYHRKL